VRKQVLHYIRERGLLKAGDRVGVAVSGGADSVALLRVLLELREELGIVLVVAHFNHQLRGEKSDADEQFVRELARSMGLELLLGAGDVNEHAKRESLSTEAAARDLRYRWLTHMAAMQNLDCVATAHTLDDQAETVLMKFLRGAGTRGLAGIYPELHRGGTKKVRFIRPLLETSRTEIEKYLTELHLPWCLDHTNLDTRLTRNRIRHELLPLLERDYNPSLRRALSETAEIARDEEDFWQTTMGGQGEEPSAQPHELQLDVFDQLHVAPQRRAVKRFLEWNGLSTDFQHVEALRRCALGEVPRVELDGGWRATASKGKLTLQPPGVPAPAAGYQYSLAIPGEILISHTRTTISARLVDAAAAAQAGLGTLLRASAVGSALTLRNWLPGDRFRPAYSGSAEKLKRLFSEKKIPADQRALWPIALNTDNEIVWVRGFPVAHDFAWIPGSGDAIKIEVLASEIDKTAS